MKKLLVFILIIAAFFTWWNSNKYSWRQKMTVTIETPNGLKSGSGVVQVDLTVRSRARIGGGKWGWRYYGEGPVIDLGDGKYVFAALFNEKRSMQPDVVMTEIHRRLDNEPNFGGDIRSWVRNLKREKRVFELEKREYPMLIAFEDINDSTTVTLLKDAGDFRRVFGHGYRLRKITVQATKESPTDGVVFNLLPWAEEHWGGTSFDGIRHLSIPTEAPFARRNSISILKRTKR